MFTQSPDADAAMGELVSALEVVKHDVTNIDLCAFIDALVTLLA